MSGLSKLGTALTIIFVISLVALLAEFFYVLWRRRVFHRQAPRWGTMQGGASADTNSQTFSDSSYTFSSFTSYSKELLYFYFCQNSSRISRVEPNSTPPGLNSSGPCPDDEMVEVIDVFKLQNMYGPPRFLFTIKEEDRENDAEYYAEKKDKSLSSSSTDNVSCNEKYNDNNDKNGSIKLREYLKAVEDEEYSSTTVLQVEEEEVMVVSVGNDQDHAVEVEGECLTETMPFSSPCESPLYFTPSSSPE